MADAKGFVEGGIQHFFWTTVMSPERIEKIIHPRKDETMSAWTEEFVGRKARDKFEELYGKDERELLRQVLSGLTGVDQICLDMNALESVHRTATSFKKVDGKDQPDWNNLDNYVDFAKTLKQMIDFAKSSDGKSIDVKKALDWLTDQRLIGQPALASTIARWAKDFPGFFSDFQKKISGAADTLVLATLPTLEEIHNGAKSLNFGSNALERASNGQAQLRAHKRRKIELHYEGTWWQKGTKNLTAIGLAIGLCLSVALMLFGVFFLTALLCALSLPIGFTAISCLINRIWPTEERAEWEIQLRELDFQWKTRNLPTKPNI